MHSVPLCFPNIKGPDDEIERRATLPTDIRGFVMLYPPVGCSLFPLPFDDRAGHIASHDPAGFASVRLLWSDWLACYVSYPFLEGTGRKVEHETRV